MVNYGIFQLGVILINVAFVTLWVMLSLYSLLSL